MKNVSRVDRERRAAGRTGSTASDNKPTPTEEQRLDEAFRELVTFTPEPDEPTDRDIAPQLRYPALRKER